MQFERYISDLLYRYECVIIPDFGAFLTQNVSAKVHETTNAFYPPKKVLSFNEQLKTNDGLLANYIASVEKIPFEAAVQKIAKKTRALKSYLNQGETLTFKHIGDLKLNAEGNIEFEPSYHLNYLTDAFGLAQFVSPSISRTLYKEAVTTPVTPEEKAPVSSEPETVETPMVATAVAPESSTNMETPEQTTTTRPYIRYAAAAVLLVSIGGFFTNHYFQGQVEAHNMIAEENAKDALDHKIQEATFVIENPLPAVTLNLDKQSGNYHIVAGAFRLEENCDKKLNELKSAGFSARKIGTNKYGLHQVVYASFETRTEAENMLATIRQQQDENAWLLVQDLD